MISNIENLKLIDIINGLSIRQRTFEDRFSHALVFKVTGESIYDFNDGKMTIKQGDVLFIPQGTSYSVKRTSDKSEYVLINFNADIEADGPEVYSMEGYSNQAYIYENLSRLWLLGGEAEKCKCYSLIYGVLYFILSKEKPQYSYVNKFNRIEQAVNYLHSNIFSCDLKVNHLHRICGVSDTYFRKIFKAKFGVSPQDYIIGKRLSQAQSIILSGEYNSIAEVALSVGYSDALYFSRIFVKKFGVCPTGLRLGG